MASAAPFGLFCIPDRAGPHCVIVSWSSDEPPVELLGAKTAQELEAAPRVAFSMPFFHGFGWVSLGFHGFFPWFLTAWGRFYTDFGAFRPVFVRF